MRPASRRILIGAYTAPRGRALGITLLEHDRRAGCLTLVGTAAAASPSALATIGPAVCAVEETRDGRVRTFHLDGSGMTALSEQSTEGGDPCHLLVTPSGRHVLTANYSTGSIVAHPITEAGELRPACDLLRFSGTGPVRGRQDASHPHQLAVRPGTAQIAVADLGADAIHLVDFDDSAGRFRSRCEPVALPPGTGPRQVLFSQAGDRAFVLGELDNSVSLVDLSLPEGPRVVSMSPALGRPAPPGNLPATLLMAPDDLHLFASHRTADVIAVLTAPLGAQTAVDEIAAGGSWPRHIAIDDRWLYVANERSHSVVAIDLEDPERRISLRTPSPAFILPITSGRSDDSPARQSATPRGTTERR